MSRRRRLIHLVASGVWGGAERYALDVCRHFAARGWSVTAYTRDAKAVDSLFQEAGIDLRHAPLQGLADPVTLRLLTSHFKSEERGAIIHAHRYRDAFLAIAARSLARRPDLRIVTTRHTVQIARDPRIFRPLYKAVDAHIFVSHLAAGRFMSAWRGSDSPIPPQRIHFIPNSLILDYAEPSPEPVKGPIIAMMHGRLVPGKGMEVLIDALPRLRGMRTRMRIVGSGNPDYVDSLRRRAFSRGVADMIDWFKYRTDVEQLISESHFGVMPSIMPEAFGLPNLEYMAGARPVITTLNGAQCEYITDGKEGLLVPPADAAALADVMQRMATDATLRSRMGKAARARFLNELEWSQIAEKLESVYASL